MSLAVRRRFEAMKTLLPATTQVIASAATERSAAVNSAVTRAAK
jgi:hypothetical protein